MEQLEQELIDANHILHFNGVVDAFGHISVRHPDNPSIFIMSANMAPALVSSATDFVQYWVEDASPVNEQSRKGFLERFIHSEIYSRYSDVGSIVHAHAEDMLPYTTTNVALVPVTHMAGFIGIKPPIFDTEELYRPGDRRDLLVGNVKLGAALASTFEVKNPSSADNPQHNRACLVLMRNHGFTVTADNIREAVYRSVYAVKNARIQTASTLLSAASSIRKVEDKNANHLVLSLTAQQAVDTAATIPKVVDRPWGLWVKEIRQQPLYFSKT